MAKIGRPRKRRNRTPHVGVKILQRLRTNGITYIGRWFEADSLSGKRVAKEVSLTALGKTSEASRIAWAKNKAAELRLRKQRGPGHLRDVKDAVDDYFAAQPDLRPKTLRIYGRALVEPKASVPATKKDQPRRNGHFLNWAEQAGVVRCDQLTPGRLADLHSYVVGLRARVPQTGKRVGRGANKPGAQGLAPASRNQALRAIRTFLNWARRRELTPELSSDAIADRLPYLKIDRPEIRWLTRSEISTLLAAAELHDKATFNYVRRGTAQSEGRDSTRTYTQIGPFVRAALLTGMRFTELAELQWSEIDLVEGTIALSPERTKTHHGRTIDLDVCPSLIPILEEMKIHAGQGSFVFGRNKAMRRDLADTARTRLSERFGSPAFTWQTLRRTCGTYLTCAPSIFGSASAFMSATRLGHSVSVAERLYLGRVKVDPSARTLEAAMGIVPVTTGPKPEQTTKR
ncbi:hypothetical protein PLCT2_01791 [Planctomycetaceae bacterium]|nr:hypothetical protein PLCT2_01791 [Planctomycetaceae bacterium]